MMTGNFATVGTLGDISRAALTAPRPEGDPRLCDLALDAVALLGCRRPVRGGANATRSPCGGPERRGPGRRRAPVGLVAAYATLCSLGLRGLGGGQPPGDPVRPGRRGFGGTAFYPRIGRDTAGLRWGIANRSIDYCGGRSDRGGNRDPAWAVRRPVARCLRGQGTETLTLIAATASAGRAGRQGALLQVAQWVEALYYNGLGRYQDAVRPARDASETVPELHISTWALPELVEAAARSGDSQLAIDAVQQFGQVAATSGTDWALGVDARLRALVSTGQLAEELLPFGDRASQSNPASPGSRSLLSPLRRVVTSPEPPGRCPRRAPRGP